MVSQSSEEFIGSRVRRIIIGRDLRDLSSFPLQINLSIPKLEPFGRSRMDCWIPDPPLLQKTEQDLTDERRRLRRRVQPSSRCGKPVVASLEKFLHEGIKVAGGKAGARGDAVTVTRDKSKKKLDRPRSAVLTRSQYDSGAKLFERQPTAKLI